MKAIFTKKVPKSIGPFPSGMVADKFLFVSGQGPFVPPNDELAPGGIKGEIKQTLENIKAVVEAAGASMDQVVRIGIYLKNMADYDVLNEVYRDFFPEHKPARTCIGINQLPNDINVEMDAIVLMK